MTRLNFSEVKFWLAEADSCINRQKRELQQRNNYPLLVSYYEGFNQLQELYPYVSAKQQLMILNEYFANTNALISEIMFQNPDIICEATRPDSVNVLGRPVNVIGNEGIMKSALTYAFDKAEALVENRLALFDMIYAGYCGVEVGHLIESTEGSLITPQYDEPKTGFIQGIVSKAKEFLGQDEAEEEAEKEMPNQDERRATSEKSFVRRWNPLNIPLDWRAETLRDLRYSFKKVYMSRAEFNTRYPDFKDKVRATEEIIDYSQHDNALYKNRVCLYEFQVKKNANKYCTYIVSPNYQMSEIDYFERPYTTNGFNIKYGTLHKYGKLYSISIGQINKKLQDEMEEYVKFIKEVAEKNIPKYLADKNKVKEDADTAIRSNKVNDIGYVDGNPNGAVVPLLPTQVSPENKELLAIFQAQKEKTWSVSASRLQGKSNVEFATELNIQEAGFQARNLDIQEGLRMLIKEELETLKDIVVTFWDGEYFFKITGGQKPEWYIPEKSINPLTGKEIILNPLTEILTADYEIKVDISSALRPNKEKRKTDAIAFIKFLMESMPILQAQGKTINIDEIKKLGQDFGFNPENLIIDIQPMNVMPPIGAEVPQGGALPAEGMPGAPLPV